MGLDKEEQIKLPNGKFRCENFARAFGEQTDSAVPLINLLELLTVNNVYRLHALRFTHLWHKDLLPNVFHNFFKYASSLHTYNTRYAASQNLYKIRVRTNTGKQTMSYMASIFWHPTGKILSFEFYPKAVYFECKFWISRSAITHVQN